MSKAAVIIKVAKTILDKDDEGLGKKIFMIAMIPVALIMIIMTFIIYLLTTPLSGVLSLIPGLDLPDSIKDFKSDHAYITYQHVTGKWGELSPPTYNNKVVDSSFTDEHKGITFKGSSLLWKRYAYAIDDGIVVSKDDNSILISHAANSRIDHPYYSYFDGLTHDEASKLEVGSIVHKGDRLNLAGKKKLYLELRDEEGTPFDPNPYIDHDSVEQDPDEEIEEIS